MDTSPDAPAPAPAPTAVWHLGDRFAYQPWLDGLRAIAVVAVLLFHHSSSETAGSGTWSGGFLGVDVFFTLSGFLITTLLLMEHHRSGRIGLAGFWLRRARRLLPALVVMLLGVSALARFVFEPPRASRLRHDALAALFYVENWYRLGHSVTAVGHTWSLAVEEQWYFVWPIVLVLLLRWTRARPAGLAVIIGALAAGSFGLSVYYSGEPRAYFGTDTRAQLLLLGALLAVGLGSTRGDWSARVQRGLDLGAVAALGLLGLLFWFADTEAAFVYCGGWTLVGCATALVITAGLRGGGLIRRVLGVAPLRAVGTISYGLYLFHWPIYWWLDGLRLERNGVELLAIRWSVTLVVTLASYWLVERPIRRGALGGRRFVAAMSIAVAATAGVIVWATPSSSVTAAQARLEAELRRWYDDARDRDRVLVAGDSAALVLGRRSPYDTVDSRGVAFGSSSCGFGGGIPLVGSTRIPVQPECYRFDDDLAIAVDGFRPDVAVLVVGGELALDREVDGATLRYGTAELEAHVRRQLDRARSTLTARGARFVLASPSCNRLPGADNAARDAWLRGVFARWAAARGVATIDLGGFECAAGVPTVVDGVPLYDGTSLSDHGVEVVWRWILDEVGEL